MDVSSTEKKTLKKCLAAQTVKTEEIKRISADGSRMAHTDHTDAVSIEVIRDVKHVGRHQEEACSDGAHCCHKQWRLHSVQPMIDPRPGSQQLDSGQDSSPEHQDH